MRLRLVLLSLVVAALTLPGAAQAAGSCPGAALVPNADNGDVAQAATVCLINRERTSRGLRALRTVSALQTVAEAYATRMARENFFAHSAPDGSTFVTRIKRTDYLSGPLRRWSVGENIAWGTGRLATPENIVRAWMRSSGHRRNILDASFTDMGLGLALGAPTAGVRSGAAGTYVNGFGERRR